jgi:hypothetical protein
MKLLKITLVIGSLVVTTGASATTYGGIEFPDGPSSFADAVVSYSPGSDVGGNFADPTSALGIPDYGSSTGATSLGDGGELVLQFTDNSLIASGDINQDLWIFEIGSATESFNVAISTDNSNWIDLGDVGGQPTGIDIDSIAGVTAGVFYSYVRLKDIAPNQSNFPFGEADIDAVGAISSAPPVPVPAAVWLFGTGIFGLLGVLRKNLIIKAQYGS